MRVYIAGRYSRRLEFCEYKRDLQDLGHVVTSRWLLGGHQIDDQGRAIGDEGEARVEAGDIVLAAKFAQDDVQDVREAQVLLAFTEAPNAGGRNRGGRHVELGLALAWCLDIVVVGPRENVFCWLPHVRQIDTWGADVLRHLGATEEQLEDARWRALP